MARKVLLQRHEPTQDNDQNFSSNVKVAKMHSIQFLECTGSIAESGKLTNFSKGTALVFLEAKSETSMENFMDEENFIPKSA